MIKWSDLIYVTNNGLLMPLFGKYGMKTLTSGSETENALFNLKAWDLLRRQYHHRFITLASNCGATMEEKWKGKRDYAWLYWGLIREVKCSLIWFDPQLQNCNRIWLEKYQTDKSRWIRLRCNHYLVLLHIFFLEVTNSSTVS